MSHGSIKKDDPSYGSDVSFGSSVVEGVKNMEWPDTNVNYKRLLENDDSSYDGDINFDDSASNEATKENESYWEMGFVRGFGHGKRF